MPVYEYRCINCVKEFESFRWAGEVNEPAPCPECGSKKTERQLSLFSSSTSASKGSCSPSGFS